MEILWREGSGAFRFRMSSWLASRIRWMARVYGVLRGRGASKSLRARRAGLHRDRTRVAVLSVIRRGLLKGISWVALRRRFRLRLHARAVRGPSSSLLRCGGQHPPPSGPGYRFEGDDFFVSTCIKLNYRTNAHSAGRSVLADCSGGDFACP